MSLITWYDKADVHREVAAAILDAFLPYGKKDSFARQAGISPQWYSYIRQAGSFSLPDISTAKLLAKHLPAPQYYKDSLYDHLSEARLAYENASKEIFFSQSNDEQLMVHINEIIQCHNQAVFSNLDPDKVKRLYLRVYELSKLVVNDISLERHPLEFLQICNPLADVSYVLDKASHGIYWAKFGRRIAENLDIQSKNFLDNCEKIQQQHFFAVRNEALGYHNLRNSTMAQQTYNYAEKLASTHQNIVFLSDTYRNRLISLSTVPRFAISDAESLATLAQNIFEKRNDYLSILMTHEALARAYIAHGTSRSLKKARKALDTSLSALDSINYAGYIHRVVIMQTIASLFWVEGDFAEWKIIMKKILAITSEVGLFHQYRKAVEKYGNAIRSLEKEE